MKRQQNTSVFRETFRLQALLKIFLTRLAKDMLFLKRLAPFLAVIFLKKHGQYFSEDENLATYS